MIGKCVVKGQTERFLLNISIAILLTLFFFAKNSVIPRYFLFRNFFLDIGPLINLLVKFAFISFKPTSKDFLIKILEVDNIDSAEKLRNFEVSISIEEIDNYLNNGLPWPGFYINEILNDNIKILSYFYSDKYIFCNVLDNEEVVIPYNEHYFAYENKKLILKNKLVN